jgi:hypothetical protein
MGFLEDCHRKQAEKIAALDPKPGQWAQLDSWFGDVWGEIISVYNDPESRFGGAMVLAQRPDHPRGEYTFFHYIRRVAAELPEDARIIHHAGGAVERRGWAAGRDIEVKVTGWPDTTT